MLYIFLFVCLFEGDNNICVFLCIVMKIHMLPQEVFAVTKHFPSFI